MEPRPAVFFDRDGTLMEEVHYCADPGLVRAVPGAAEMLRRLTAGGFLCVIITNQSGIGRGMFTLAQYEAVQAELLRQLGGAIAATYMCPDLDSPRRKPETGMVLEAVRDLRIDPARSWFVGDKPADIECGFRAGTRTILVETGYGQQYDGKIKPDFGAKNVVEAGALILQNRDASGF